MVLKRGSDRASGHRTSRVLRPLLGLVLAGAASVAAVGIGADAAYAGNADFRLVFQANTTDLGGFSSSGSDFVSSLPMNASSSPALAALSDGTDEAAFEYSDNHLAFYHLGGGSLHTQYGMEAGSSPAIAALPSGGWIAAFETNDQQLYLYSSKLVLTKTSVGMMAGTSPAIAVQADGSYRVVVEANTGVLAGYNSSGSTYTTSVAMNHGASPAIAAKPDGSYEAAAETSGNTLTTLHIASGILVNPTTLGMNDSTNPSIGVQSDGSFRVMFESNTHALNGFNSSGSSFSTNVAMRAGTSPSIAPLTDGSYEVAIESSADDLTTLHIASGISVNPTSLGLKDSTNPAVGVPTATAPPSVATKEAALANANVGKTAGSCASPATTNSLGGSSYYTSCSGVGAEAWCADFAKWVWNGVGINVTGLTPAAGSFVANASQNGSTVHTSSSYNAQVGDAVVYNYGYHGAGTAEHVGLVVAVNSDGSITTDNGDFGSGGNIVTSTVLSIRISASQKYVGDTPSGVVQTISAFVTPSGLS